MLPISPDTVSCCAAGVGGNNAVGGLSVFGFVCAGMGCSESEEGEVGGCALDIWWGVWYLCWVGVGLIVVLGMKELYGGGLFVRESNNTLIFVRSSYRVSRIHRVELIISWVRLDGLRDLHLPGLADFLMRDCMIRWLPHFNV